MSQIKRQADTYSFKIGVFSGDIIYLLSSIKHTCEQANRKAEIYISLNHPWGDSVEGQKHPYGVNRYAFDMMRPLVESQSYIACFKEWKGEKITQDLDEMRTQTHSTMPHGSIMRWAGQIWPDMQPDGNKDWLEVDTGSWAAFPAYDNLNLKEKILINRTARWRNDHINYWFLREHKEHLIFTGLPEEHEDFCKSWELDIPLLKVQDFLELAVAIKTCRYFIGNQSLCFALAEAMKVPRLLEICRYAPNVIPSGPGGYDFMHQFALEWFVKNEYSPFNEL